MCPNPKFYINEMYQKTVNAVIVIDNAIYKFFNYKHTNG